MCYAKRAKSVSWYKGQFMCYAKRDSNVSWKKDQLCVMLKGISWKKC